MKLVGFSTYFFAIICIFAAVCPAKSEKHLYSPPPAIDEIRAMPPSAPAEVALIEVVAAQRDEYRLALEKLRAYYEKSGNDMKLGWVKKELRAIAAAPRYSYMIDAEVAGPSLKASVSIPEADELFDQAMAHYSKGKTLGLFKNNKQLGLALDKFNQLIREYPVSNKIDDSAFYAGRIYEMFGDYSIAATYYQRAFQWNPKIDYPARYRAALVYDWKLKRRQDALVLYQQALALDPITEANREYIEERILVMSSPEFPQNQE